MNFDIDKDNATVHVKREFAAPVTDVWKAWTEPALLDQWWAPKPWKAVTHHMDLREGGHWLYAMVGPENEDHFARLDYEKTTAPKHLEGLDAFCDKTGQVNSALPRTKWITTFTKAGDDTTLVQVYIKHDNLADLEKIIEMGFREGFTAALENLDDLLASTR